MKKAVIMARVSSDEQAAGYSLDSQMEQLKRFCQQRDIEIVYEFREDYSAKTFERPAFQSFLKIAKQNKGWVDCFLFISWDRFSRNTTDAYNMIRTLKKLTIETQAITQPIDFSVPENKFLLAFYLAFPEVDNDRRSIKIKDGIRMARKSGRWVSSAPKGYLNSRDENKKPFLIPDPKYAPLIQLMFEMAANGITYDKIRSELRKKGLVYSRNGVSVALHNPLYIGRIIIPPDEDNPTTEIIQAIHEPIISEELFYKVHDILSKKNNRKKVPKNKRFRAELPLRGVLICSNCGNNLTGSPSRSKTGAKHFYYHCNNCRKERFRAALVNDELNSLLDLFQIKISQKELYNQFLKQDMISNDEENKKDIAKAKKELGVTNQRLDNIQLLLIDGNLDADEYRKLKAKFLSEKVELNKRIGISNNTRSDIVSQVSDTINFLNNITNTMKTLDIESQQELLSSIFPEKIQFDGKKCRTPKINEAIRIILATDKGSRNKKERDKLENAGLSLRVENRGVEPLTFRLPV